MKDIVHSFGIDIIYTAIILILCMMVYFKTNEMYNLTKHKGIQFFRIAFLFFGFAYAIHLLLNIMIFGSGMFGRFKELAFPICHLSAAFLSTMAILFLSYGLVSKKVKPRLFFIYSLIVALAIAVIAFVFMSPLLTGIIQLVLIIGAILLSLTKKKKHAARAIYILISVFWLINLFLLTSKRLLSLQSKIIFELLSIALFLLIYYKVTKWIK